MLRILSFLVYDPFLEPRTRSERMRAMGREMGWMIKEADNSLGIDESTWWPWERTGKFRWLPYRQRLRDFLSQKENSSTHP